MKCIVDFPGGIWHLNQARFKKVRIRDDAPDIYNSDPRWQHIIPPRRELAMRILDATRGREGILNQIFRDGLNMFYEVQLPPPPFEIEDLQGLPMKISLVTVAVEYAEVIDSGYMEAS